MHDDDRTQSVTSGASGRDGYPSNRATEIDGVASADPEQAGDESPASRGFDVALSFIDSQILAGVYANGTRLPAERDLAAQLGVSRGAVREAIRVLQAQGILVSGTGRSNGTRVQARPSNAMGRILRLQLALDVVSFADLTETRVALERAACAAAARRREPGPLARATELLEQMRSVESPDPFNELDTAFHVALAEAGDNTLMSNLTVAIRKSVETPISSAEHALTSWSALREMLMSQHQEMLEAITAGDGDRAAQVSEEHIRVAYQKLLGMD